MEYAGADKAAVKGGSPSTAPSPASAAFHYRPPAHPPALVAQDRVCLRAPGCIPIPALCLVRASPLKSPFEARTLGPPQLLFILVQSAGCSDLGSFTARYLMCFEKYLKVQLCML